MGQHSSCSVQSVRFSTPDSRMSGGGGMQSGSTLGAETFAKVKYAKSPILINSRKFLRANFLEIFRIYDKSVSKNLFLFSPNPLK